MSEPCKNWSGGKRTEAVEMLSFIQNLWFCNSGKSQILPLVAQEILRAFPGSRRAQRGKRMSQGKAQPFCTFTDLGEGSCHRLCSCKELNFANKHLYVGKDFSPSRLQLCETLSMPGLLIHGNRDNKCLLFKITMFVAIFLTGNLQ